MPKSTEKHLTLVFFHPRLAKEKEDVYADLDRSRDKYEKLQSSMIRMEEEKDKIETDASRHLAQV